ncbi:hypothetical protein PIB30_085238 [Stylosanthes scabra]|uniref:Fe2OG dioxygenase domain-containing protein n=1 Tax=Stylosanthes scabra TaxID=79078 RepID=A0ABU6WSF3_9FABA|nr:hypothetical protein [Stylosanthes scabra]
MGLNPHSHAGALTILLQANDVEGLQWIPVKPLPNAFIINVGDALEIMTKGIYESIEHRATVNANKERISIATFFVPSRGSIIGPAPNLVTPETPAIFTSISCEEYYHGYLSKELRGKDFVNSLKITKY